MNSLVERVRRYWSSRGGRSQSSNASRTFDAVDEDLKRYFTNAEEPREAFKAALSHPHPPKRLVIIHGLGAMGKSSLLQMYRLHCREQHVPVALVGAQDTSAAVDVLAGWASRLKDEGVALPTFAGTLAHFRELGTQIHEDRQKAEKELGEKALHTAGQIVIDAIVPGVGTAVELAGLAEPASDYLLAKFSRSDVDLHRDPTGRLTDDFLADLISAAKRKRVVLMLDTFDHVKSLTDWLRDLVQRLGTEDVIVVVAGRELPAWDHAWPGWPIRAECFQLREMPEQEIKKLIRTYADVAYNRQLTTEELNALAAIPRGMPMAAVIVAKLLEQDAPGSRASQDRVADLVVRVKSQVVGDLAAYLFKGVTDKMRPAFEAAAVLRSFNGESLGALLGEASVRQYYDELRQWPFVRTSPNGLGLAIHDLMRVVMNDAHEARSPEAFRRLHEQAANYYQGVFTSAKGDEIERPRLEWLYHVSRVNETVGVQRFQELAESLVRNQLVSRLRALLNDVDSYAGPSERQFIGENGRSWLEYYKARLDHLQGRIADAEKAYRVLGERVSVDRKLRAYALCDLGTILDDFDRLAQPDGEQRALNVIQESLRLVPDLDQKLVSNYTSLMNISNARAEWRQSLDHLEIARSFAESKDNTYEVILTDHLQAVVYALQGDWSGYLTSRARCLSALDQFGDLQSVRMQVSSFTWPLLFMGRHREAQMWGEEALRLAIQLEEKEVMITVLESLALALGAQERYAEATAKFTEAMTFYESVHGAAGGQDGASEGRYIRATLSFRGLISLREGQIDVAERDLQRALNIKRAIGDHIGIPELHVWRGHAHELREQWSEAASEYLESLKLSSVRRQYIQCAAFTGLVRTEAARRMTWGASPYFQEAMQLASQYAYHDQLASLFLTRGHVAWEGRASHGENGFDSARSHYQESLMHALHYNRLLLDEVLAGRQRGTFLRPIIPYCRERGAAGRLMLQQLRTWWNTASDITVHGPDPTVSRIAPDLPLLEAERNARRLEQGAGAAEKTVIEQIDAAL